MARWVVAAALTACLRVAAAQGQAAMAISNGIGLLARRDVAGAMREFHLAARDSSPGLRSAGEQWLGHLSWMVYADAKSSAEHLDRALIGVTDSSGVLVERARLLAFQRRYREASGVAAAAMRRGSDGERHGLAARTLVDVAVDGAFSAVAAKASVMDSIDAPSVQEALDTLRVRVQRFPGRTLDAKAMLEAAVLLRDRDALWTSWLSYFALTDELNRAPANDGRLLALTYPSTGAGTESPGEALATSRLYEPAALWIEVQRQRPRQRFDPALEDVAAYGLFLHQLRVATNECYRRTLVGVAREGDLDRTTNRLTHSLWLALHWPAAVPQYYPAAVAPELKKRFATIMSIERGSIPELQLAHAIDSFMAAAPISSGGVSQRVVVLDAPANNGMNSWLLDGASGRAGWVSGDSIFELRTAFTEAPFRAWIALADPPPVDEALRITRDSVADVARARADSTAYLPGVATRIFRAGAFAIFDSLSRQSLPYAKVEGEFIKILFRQLMETTITLHESRHLADARRLSRRSSDADAEFRAKLDEVGFASRPKLAMTAILHPNTGDATPHGQANRRIMLRLIAWIRAHSSEIAGFDDAVPPLVQLPLLSDAQLRAAFLSMRGAR